MKINKKIKLYDILKIYVNNTDKRGITMIKRANFLFIEQQDDGYLLYMTPELQDDIGTVGFVEFVDADELEVGDPILNLEASKTVLEVEAPLAGKIMAKNDQLNSEPALLNAADKNENWIVKLTDVDSSAFAELEDE